MRTFPFFLTTLAIIFITFHEIQAQRSLSCTVGSAVWVFSDAEKDLITCYKENQGDNPDAAVITNTPDASIQAFNIIDNKKVHYVADNLAEVFPKLIAVQIRNCSLSEVKRTHFGKLAELRCLTLAMNEIRIIESDSFDDLQHLEFLSLGWNKVKIINSDLFKFLINLRQLYLHDNLIEAIDAGTFSTLVKLDKLALHGNKIKALAPGTFGNLVNLKILSLHNNSLVEIHEDLLKKNYYLLGVWLNSNKLELIPSGAFDHLRKLRRLDLRKNVCIDRNFRFIDIREVRDELNELCSTSFFSGGNNN